MVFLLVEKVGHLKRCSDRKVVMKPKAVNMRYFPIAQVFPKKATRSKKTATMEKEAKTAIIM